MYLYLQMTFPVFVVQRLFVESFVAFIAFEPPDPGVDRHVIISGSTHSEYFCAVVTLVLDACVSIHVNLVVPTVVYSCFTLVTVEVESPCVRLHVTHQA